MSTYRRLLAVTVVTLAVSGVVTAAAVARSAAPAAAHDDGHDGLIRPVVTTDADWAPVVAALGRSGKLAGDGTSYRVGFPRRDLTVTSQGVTIRPSFALGGYAAFARYPGGHAMVMGDLVVTEAEAPAVTDALQAGGLQQTAIHKHLLAETPPVWWMHINGMGNPVALARAVKAALDTTATPRRHRPPRRAPWTWTPPASTRPSPARAPSTAGCTSPPSTARTPSANSATSSHPASESPPP